MGDDILCTKCYYDSKVDYEKKICKTCDNTKMLYVCYTCCNYYETDKHKCIKYIKTHN